MSGAGLAEDAARVLVVEDTPTQAELARILLTGIGLTRGVL